MSAGPTLPTLMTKLVAAERRGANDTDADEILALMQTAATLPGGMEQLVERFAGSPVDVLARTLAFVLARSVSASDTPGAVAPLVWSAVSALGTDDESARVNLLSAIQLLGARGALPSTTQPVPAGLGAFMIDVLRRGEEVLDAAGPALLSLDAHGFIERLNRGQRQTIQEILKKLAEPDNPFARADMAALRDRLGALDRKHARRNSGPGNYPGERPEDIHYPGEDNHCRSAKINDGGIGVRREPAASGPA